MSASPTNLTSSIQTLSSYVTFIPLNLQGLTVSRSDGPGMKTRNFSPPYTQFPAALRCQAHPYFVILKAFLALDSFDGLDGVNQPPVLLETFALLHSIVTLWKELSDFPLAEDEPPAPAPSTSVMK